MGQESKPLLARACILNKFYTYAHWCKFSFADKRICVYVVGDEC